jgi:hypothetical protein
MWRKAMRDKIFYAIVAIVVGANFALQALQILLYFHGEGR